MPILRFDTWLVALGYLECREFRDSVRSRPVCGDSDLRNPREDVDFPAEGADEICPDFDNDQFVYVVWDRPNRMHRWETFNAVVNSEEAPKRDVASNPTT